MTDPESLATEVAAIQVAVLEAARSSFTEREVEDLRCVVRLAVEFQHYLQRIQVDAMDPEDLDYLSGSVFAGVDSFSSVAKAYTVLGGATSSRIAWTTFSMLSSPLLLREHYLATYREFLAETSFETKCRILLDLFKLQLVFVAILYNW